MTIRLLKKIMLNSTAIKRVVLLLVGLVWSCFIKAQPTLDTIKWCLQQKPQLFGKLDSRNSFISNSRAKVFGVKAGLGFGNRLFFGLGYNQLYPISKNFDETVYFQNSNHQNDSATASLQLYYFSTHVEYAYFQTAHWDLSIMLQLGAGQTFYKYTSAGQKKETNPNFIFIYEPAISAEYKIINWVGVGADAGFRFVVSNYKHLNQQFNSPTYAFKLLIYYNEIYKSLVKKKVET